MSSKLRRPRCGPKRSHGVLGGAVAAIMVKLSLIVLGAIATSASLEIAGVVEANIGMQNAG